MFYLSQSLNDIVLKKSRIQQVFVSEMLISEWLCAVTLALGKNTYNNLILKLKCSGTEVNKEQVLCMNIFLFILYIHYHYG